MKNCMLCGKSTEKLYKITSNGEVKGVCKKCAVSNKNRVCRVCGAMLEKASINGMCIICAQTDLTNRSREAEEIANTGGIGTISSPSEFTDADVEKWLTAKQD